MPSDITRFKKVYLNSRQLPTTGSVVNYQNNLIRTVDSNRFKKTYAFSLTKKQDKTLYAHGLRSPALTPEQLLGITNWYRADSSLNTVSSGFVVTARDLIGSADLSQSTPGNQFVYYSNFGDGAQAWEGPGWLVGSPTITLSGDFTLVVLLNGCNSDGAVFEAYKLAAEANRNQIGVRDFQGIAVEASLFNDAGVGVSTPVVLSGPVNTWVVLAYRRNGTDFSQDAWSSGSGHQASSTTLAGPLVNAAELVLGAYRTDGTGAVGHRFRELQIYPSALSDDDLLTLRTNLQNRWPNVP